MCSRKRGASLMYVLIIMSIMTVCAVNFVYFVKQRQELVKMREDSK